MNPENMAMHFSRVKSIIDKFDIQYLTRIFNVARSACSIRGMTSGRFKYLVETYRRVNRRGVQFRGTVFHVILRTVVSASGQVLTPLVDLRGN